MEDQTYNNMDVDDLFGDSEPVALPNMNTLPAPPVKGLPEKLDELSSNGCNSKIAWGKNGCVAYITPDGYAINLRVFARDPSTGKWDLGPECPLELPHNRDELPLVHLSWGNLGSDLTAVDTAGHVMIFTALTMTLGQMTFRKLELSSPEMDMNPVVGMHWLSIFPHELRVHITWLANNIDGRWRFKTTPHALKDMYHPADGKAALMYLKSSGDLRLRYQQSDNSWHEISTSLGSMTSTKEAFTHASFASSGKDNALLMVAHDSARRLHLYRIDSVWNIPPQKPGQPPPKYPKPELQVSKIATEDECHPARINSDLTDDVDSRVRVPAQLTHLNFLSPSPEGGEDEVPVVVAIFVTPPNIVGVDQTHTPQTHFSIVVRWEVHELQQNQLHPSLDKVTSKRKAVSSVPVASIWSLKRQTDTILHSMVVSFTPVWFHITLAFSYSDGTVEFRKRTTMDSITPDFKTDIVSSMSQAGFSFPNLETPLHIALSPNFCIAACMQQDGKIKLRPMEYAYGSLASDNQGEGQSISAALAAMMLRYANASHQYFESNDILAVLSDVHEERQHEFVNLIFDSLNIKLDCGLDEGNSQQFQHLSRGGLYPKALSAIHILGLKGTYHRSLASKLSWMILNVRWVTQCLMTLSRVQSQVEKGGQLRPDTVIGFIGICRYVTHFAIYMIDELFTVAREFSKIPSDELTGQVIEAKIRELNKPTVLLLLSGFFRHILKVWLGHITFIKRFTAHHMQHGTHELRKVFGPLGDAMQSSAIDWSVFEQLITEASSVVRICFRDSAKSTEERELIERQLLHGRLPDKLVPAAKHLITDVVYSEKSQVYLNESLDMAQIMFFDTTWLGLDTSRSAIEWLDTHVVDVCQKTIIKGTSPLPHNTPQNRSDTGASADGLKKSRFRLRRCVRCSSYMEDFGAGVLGKVNVMGVVSKQCICGNNWMSVLEKQS